jgi:hypothetical protein
VRESFRFARQEFKTVLPADAALVRLTDLLKAEGIRFELAGAGARSTSIPLAIFSFDPVQYTWRNWVGLNPFVWFSSIDVECSPVEGGANVAITLDRRRLILFCGFWSVNLAVIASRAPVGVILGVAAVVAIGNLVGWRLAKSLLRTEVLSALKVSEG